MIRFEFALAEDIDEYVRNVRLETLRAIAVMSTPVLTAPIPQAIYTLALDGERRIGMTECAFHHDLVGGYDELPFGHVTDLARLCPFPLMSGIRTIYVEPEYRVRAPLFLHLCLAAAYVFRTMGSPFATAATAAANSDLCALYDKLGGKRLGTFFAAATGATELMLYLFDLNAMVRHAAMDRVRSRLNVDFHRLHLARRRGRPEPLFPIAG